MTPLGKALAVLRALKLIAKPVMELVEMVQDNVAERRRERREAADEARRKRDIAILDRLKAERDARGRL